MQCPLIHCPLIEFTLIEYPLIKHPLIEHIRIERPMQLDRYEKGGRGNEIQDENFRDKKLIKI